MTALADVLAWLGRADIYVVDQLMGGRLAPGMRVLDAGCGKGRNAELLVRAGLDVHGVDESESAIAHTRARAIELAPSIDPTNFRVAPIESLDFADDTFDAVLCVAALHFARDPEHFDAMIGELWRVLRPGGLWFARLATTISVEDHVTPLGAGRFRMGDGTERFLVDEATLLARTEALRGELVGPLKTTNVQNRRAMTTWVARKG